MKLLDLAPGQRWHAFNVVASAALLILICLGLMAAAPLYEVVSRGIAPRIEEEYPVRAWLMRIFDLPLLLACVGAVLALAAKTVGRIFALQVGGVVAFFMKWIRRLVIAGLLERFTTATQLLVPQETGRLLIGLILLVVGLLSRFGYPRRVKRAALLLAAAALIAEALAAWIWDSGWIRFNLALVGGLVAAGWYRHRRWQTRWFGWLELGLFTAQVELFTFARAAWADGMRTFKRLVGPSTPAPNPLEPHPAQRRLEATPAEEETG